MKTRLNQGQWTYKAPVGYLNILNPLGSKTLAPDPKQSELVQKAFELFSTGLYSKSEVLAKVTGLGLRTKSGRRLTCQDFKRLLSNPLYAGMVTVKGWDIWTKGNFPSLITQETFEAVQALLKGSQRYYANRRNAHPDFPLRHFVKCGACGKPLTASWSKGRNGRFVYYRCQSRSCPTPVNIRKHVIEEEFLDS